jgi:hypothetical protein
LKWEIELKIWEMENCEAETTKYKHKIEENTKIDKFIGAKKRGE